MAAKKNYKSDKVRLHKEWFVLCEGKCAGKEQKVVTALVLGGKGKRKRAMCTGCREFLPDDARPFKA